MLCLLVMAIALCSGTVAEAPVYPEDPLLNQFIDMAMDYLQKAIVDQGLDPAKLPDQTVRFKKEIMGITWYGKAGVYNGLLRGLASVHRTGNSQFIRNGEDVVTGLKTAIGVDDMKGHYDCFAKFMDLGPEADVRIDVAGASMSFSADLNRDVCRFHVTHVNIDDIGNIDVQVHGLGSLDWILDFIVTMVVNIVKVNLNDVIENNMKNLINNVLQTIDFSIIGPIIGCEPKSEPTDSIIIPWTRIENSIIIPLTRIENFKNF